MPELVQPIVYSLPLSSVVSSLREIANDGASLFSFSTSTIGLSLTKVLIDVFKRFPEFNKAKKIVPKC